MMSTCLPVRQSDYTCQTYRRLRLVEGAPPAALTPWLVRAVEGPHLAAFGLPIVEGEPQVGELGEEVESKLSTALSAQSEEVGCKMHD